MGEREEKAPNYSLKIPPEMERDDKYFIKENSDTKQELLLQQNKHEHKITTWPGHIKIILKKR